MDEKSIANSVVRSFTAGGINVPMSDGMATVGIDKGIGYPDPFPSRVWIWPSSGHGAPKMYFTGEQLDTLINTLKGVRRRI